MAKAKTFKTPKLSNAEVARKEQTDNIQRMFAALKEIGLNFEDQFKLPRSNHVEISLDSLAGIGHLYRSPFAFNLSNVNPADMLLMIVHQAYQKGHDQGQADSNTSNLTNLMQAFPNLRTEMERIAEDAINSHELKRSNGAW